MTTARITEEILEHVRAHADHEGREDYRGRAEDVAAGREPLAWAWPPNDPDEAYINAIGTSAICKQLVLPEESWSEIAETWCTAFVDAYTDEGSSEGTVR